MRKLLEFQILDENADKLGFDLSALMKNAGSKVANYITDNYSNNKKITIVCGHGNNGGDGYVVANILIEKGFQVSVLSSGLSKSSIANNLPPDADPLANPLIIKPICLTGSNRILINARN